MGCTKDSAGKDVDTAPPSSTDAAVMGALPQLERICHSWTAQWRALAAMKTACCEFLVPGEPPGRPARTLTRRTGMTQPVAATTMTRMTQPVAATTMTRMTQPVTATTMTRRRRVTKSTSGYQEHNDDVYLLKTIHTKESPQTYDEMVKCTAATIEALRGQYEKIER